MLGSQHPLEHFLAMPTSLYRFMDIEIKHTQRTYLRNAARCIPYKELFNAYFKYSNAFVHAKLDIEPVPVS